MKPKLGEITRLDHSRGKRKVYFTGDPTAEAMGGKQGEDQNGRQANEFYITVSRMEAFELTQAFWIDSKELDALAQGSRPLSLD